MYFSISSLVCFSGRGKGVNKYTVLYMDDSKSCPCWPISPAGVVLNWGNIQRIPVCFTAQTARYLFFTIQSPDIIEKLPSLFLFVFPFSISFVVLLCFSLQGFDGKQKLKKIQKICCFFKTTTRLFHDHYETQRK